MKRARRRAEKKQLTEVWRSCTRNNVETDDSYLVLNPAAGWQQLEIVIKGMMWADTGALPMRRAEQLITI